MPRYAIEKFDEKLRQEFLKEINFPEKHFNQYVLGKTVGGSGNDILLIKHCQQ